MQTTSTNASSSSWQTLRSLYDFYCALAREFVIEMQPCAALESGSAPESDTTAREWFAEMDQRIEIATRWTSFLSNFSPNWFLQISPIQTSVCRLWPRPLSQCWARSHSLKRL